MLFSHSFTRFISIHLVILVQFPLDYERKSYFSSLCVPFIAGLLSCERSQCKPSVINYGRVSRREYPGVILRGGCVRAALWNRRLHTWCGLKCRGILTVGALLNPGVRLGRHSESHNSRKGQSSLPLLLFPTADSNVSVNFAISPWWLRCYQGSRAPNPRYYQRTNGGIDPDSSMKQKQASERFTK